MKIFATFMRGSIQLSLLAIVALIFGGCKAPSAFPPKSVVNDPNGNFHLYVSNQSSATNPVDIKVFIDGQQIVNEAFETGAERSYEPFTLKLSPGRHKIVAESSKGRAKLERTFKVNDKLWVALDYWFYPKPEGGAEPCPRHFSLDMKEEPIYFF